MAFADYLNQKTETQNLPIPSEIDIELANDAKDFHSHSEAKIVADVHVRVTGIYQLDLKKRVNRIKYTGEQLEFMRRVWWAYYISVSSEIIFTSKYPSIDSRGIFVDLPINDYTWRYGNLISSYPNKHSTFQNSGN
ncbi:hypothetical protein BB558_000535 [Smittium angustum]|uniref:Transcription factor domain-containing protein n=1 Tax=Smittium angustum TaxID=133377 RepID=A0A2U1JE96_SMIAN|nr:hypothetical protein BB558_000535 [Smittium angustum]